MNRLLFAVVFICFSVGSISAQDVHSRIYKRALIPANLQRRLTKRIGEFVEMQRREQWQRIFDFLIYSQNNSVLPQYTTEQKQCIAERIKAHPLVNFEISEALMTTANFTKPLNQKLWFIRGDAEFKSGSGNIKKKERITVRYFNNNWFLSLPGFYEEEWEREIFARVDLSAEMNQFLKVIEQPESPVEIFDISVKIRPTSYGLRDYSFKVRNKTRKTITSYGYRLVEFGTLVGSPNDIEPGEFTTNNGFYGSNHWFCEERERATRLFITDVQFSDGTGWVSSLKNLKSF